MTGRVEKPIFVVGTGRCGLSLVVNILGTHEDMAWFSQWTARYPRSNLAPKIPYLSHRPRHQADHGPRQPGGAQAAAARA